MFMTSRESAISFHPYPQKPARHGVIRLRTFGREFTELRAFQIRVRVNFGEASIYQRPFAEAQGEFRGFVGFLGVFLEITLETPAIRIYM
jgi:hypothetical protein